LKIKSYIIFFIILLSGKLSAQSDSIKIDGYEINDNYFVDYLGLIRPDIAVLPCEGGAFSPNWQLWYFKTRDSILSIEPSYIDTTLILTRTTKNIFEIIKVSTDTIKKKIIPLVLTKGLVFYAVPSNYIKGLIFYVVWNKNKFNICQYYNSKVDTIFHCDKMISQLEVINKSKIIFSYENKIVIYPLTGKPSLLFDAGKSNIFGVCSDNAGGLFVSLDKGILKIDDNKQQKLISTDSIKGKLKYFNKKLYILDAVNMSLYVMHLPSSLAVSEDKQPKKTLTNASIITFVKEKFTDDKIVKLINSSNADYNLSTNSVIDLTKQNVSSVVIEAMAKAMDKKK